MTIGRRASKLEVEDGLIRRKVVLEFPRDLLDKPVVYSLSRRYNIQFNILRASVNDGRGYLVLELEGSSSNYDSGMAFLRELGVEAELLTERISLDRAECTDCGACVGICPTNSFTQDPETMEIRFNIADCIACGMCIKACPTRAITLHVVPTADR